MNPPFPKHVLIGWAVAVVVVIGVALIGGYRGWNWGTMSRLFLFVPAFGGLWTLVYVFGRRAKEPRD